ncbi:MAG TPA: hypothetical protein VH951_07330 [Dehalococcoidia bacterium]
MLLLAFVGVACSGGGHLAEEPPALPTPVGNGYYDQELGFAFSYPENWAKAEPCSMPLTPFKPCKGSQYRPLSPGEQALGISGAALYTATVSSPGDPEQGIIGAATGQGRPFEGVYFVVRRLPRSMTSTEYTEAWSSGMTGAARAVAASVMEIGSREIGGSQWLWSRYELKSWGQCIYMGATGCTLATGRVWEQAFSVRGDLEFMISCEGSSQRSRTAKSGPPKLEPFEVLEQECQLVFDSFRLQDRPAEAPRTAATTGGAPGSSPAKPSAVTNIGPAGNLAPDPSFEASGGPRAEWRFVPGNQASLGGGAVDTTIAHSGPQSLRVDGQVFLNARGECSLTQSQGEWRTNRPIEIDAGKSYVFSVWHFGEEKGPATTYDSLRVTFLNEAGGRVGEGVIGITSTARGWAEGSLSIRPQYPLGTKYVTLSLGYLYYIQQPLRDACPVGEILSIWYDDAEFRVVP